MADVVANVEASQLRDRVRGWIDQATSLVERDAPEWLDEYWTDYTQGAHTVPALGAEFHRLRAELQPRVEGLERVIVELLGARG